MHMSNDCTTAWKRLREPRPQTLIEDPLAHIYRNTLPCAELGAHSYAFYTSTNHEVIFHDL